MHFFVKMYVLFYLENNLVKVMYIEHEICFYVQRRYIYIPMHTY